MDNHSLQTGYDTNHNYKNTSKSLQKGGRGFKGLLRDKKTGRFVSPHSKGKSRSRSRKRRGRSA